MKAIILAAGRGSRMLGHTEDKPKCMVELGGKPLLLWQLEALRHAGVRDIAVVCGYLGEQLERMGASVRMPGPSGFATIKNERWQSTNMLSSLLCAADWAGGQPCVVSYSDIVYPAGHVSALSAGSHALAIAYDTLWKELWSLRFANPLDDAETFREEGGILKEIGGKTRNEADICGQYMGLLLLREQGWRLLRDYCRKLGEQTEKTDMTAFLRLLLADGRGIGAIPVEGRWCEVDSGDDLALYQQQLAACNSIWKHNWIM